MDLGLSEHSVTGATFGKSFGARCDEGTIETEFDKPWKISGNADEIRW